MGLFAYTNYLSRHTDDKLMLEKYNIDIPSTSKKLASYSELTAEKILDHSMNLISESYYPTLTILFENGEELQINRKYICDLITSDIIARALLHFVDIPEFVTGLPFDDPEQYRDLSKLYPRPDGETFRYDKTYSQDKERIIRDILGLHVYNSKDLSSVNAAKYKVNHWTNYAYFEYKDAWFLLDDPTDLKELKDFRLKKKYVITSPNPDLIKSILQHRKTFPLLADESNAFAYRRNLNFYKAIFNEFNMDMTCEKVFFLERLTNINLINNYATLTNQTNLKYKFHEKTFLDLCLFPCMLNKGRLIDIFFDPRRHISSIRILQNEYHNNDDIECIFVEIIKMVSTKTYPMIFYTFTRLLELYVMACCYSEIDLSNLEERIKKSRFDRGYWIEVEEGGPVCAKYCTDLIKKSQLYKTANLDAKSFIEEFIKRDYNIRRINDTGQRLCKLVYPAYRNNYALTTILQFPDYSLLRDPVFKDKLDIWDNLMYPHFVEYM